jgi:hypothetical protein
MTRFGPPAPTRGDAGLRRYDETRPHGGRARQLGAGAALALVLAACSAQPDAPGAVTADEAQQLNEAAAMLDANSVDANVLDTPSNTIESDQ